jgi:hypothetical protein
VKTDDTSATPDADAQRFAAALEGPVADGVVDAELARELEIARMLAESGSAYAPDPEAKARAKRRLLAALADESPEAADGPRAS